MRRERWKSTLKNREDHYYIKGTEVYLFGFNPKIFSKNKVRKFFKKQLKKK